jgi:acylphosphatase
VQGVFYRARASEKAKQLNLTGWVQNEPSGSVKILAEGEEEQLEKLIEWAKQGPALARVDKIEVKWDKAKEEFKYFEIIY